jgi:Fe-S-cluster containining protein
MELSVDEFVQRYARLSEDRRGLSLMERADHACVFLGEAPVSCRIQAVKPRQCKDFPGRWRYADLPAVCAGARASQELRPP